MKTIPSLFHSSTQVYDKYEKLEHCNHHVLANSMCFSTRKRHKTFKFSSFQILITPLVQMRKKFVSNLLFVVAKRHGKKEFSAHAVI